jgi:hypothetical protein
MFKVFRLVVVVSFASLAAPLPASQSTAKTQVASGTTAAGL